MISNIKCTLVKVNNQKELVELHDVEREIGNHIHTVGGYSL
jgi:hypothetical protein